MIVTIEKAVDCLSKGKLVAIPTETVYGLAAPFTNISAIDTIFVTKGRPSDNPIIVHISDFYQLQQLTDEINEHQQALMSAFWPGPLTLLFKKKPTVLDRITAGLDSVAVRMPEHKTALEIIHQTGPLVAPSANKSGKPSTTRVEHVLHDYSGLIPVVDGGPCSIGIESTVLDVTDSVGVLLRPGKVTLKDIHSVLPDYPIEVAIHAEVKNPKSPGMKYTHYAPSALVRWMNPNELEGVYAESVRYLHVHGTFNTAHHKGYQSNFQLLTKDLFDQFRYADLENYEQIAIEPFSEQDNPLADALLNRIRKAISAKEEIPNHKEMIL